VYFFETASKEYFHQEKDLASYVNRFRSDKATKQLLAVSAKSALHYCGSVLPASSPTFKLLYYFVSYLLSMFCQIVDCRGQWAPCESDDSQYDDAGIV
jgi:hypothetical protein